MEPWKRLDETIVYSGYRKLSRRLYRLPDGQAAEFEIRLEPLVVCILPVTDEQMVILARQFRPGPEAVLLELPGGGVEPGEAPEAAARRELMEETGYEGDLHFTGETLSSAYSTMRRYNFVALHCKRVSDPRLDAEEFIEVVEMPLVAFRDHLRGGQLTDVATGYLGLDFLGWL